MKIHKRMKFAVNAEGEKPKALYATFSMNIKGVEIKDGEMEGRKYKVVPMVMINEGVHNGSGGPLMYPGDELAKCPEAWNHKPVVVYHPTINGEGVSACSPDMITAHKIGVIMNTQYDTKQKRLTAEAWIEEARAKQVDARVWNNIQKKKTTECSTGLFFEKMAEKGTFNNEDYDASVSNIIPDHLAVLPDQKGACSIQDGAGFIRNEAKQIGGKLGKALESFISNFEEQQGENFLTNAELSYDEIRDKIYGALAIKYPPTKDTAGYSIGYPYIVALYDGYVIFNKLNKLYTVDYSISKDGDVTLVGVPVEVERVTTYKTKTDGNTLTGGITGNATKQKGKTMNRKDKIDKMIANKVCTENERAAFDKMDEGTFDNIYKLVENVTPAPEKKETPKEEKTPIVNKEEKKIAANAEEYLKDVPEEIRNMIQNALATEKKQKDELVSKIVANKKNKFTKEYLGNLSIDALNNIVELLPTEEKSGATDFSANGSAAGKETAANAEEETPLEMPSLFATNKKEDKK